MLKILNLKISSNINSLWNFGSILSIYLLIQFFIGFFLSINYLISNNKFFNSIIIILNLNFGWLIRLIHRNLTSLIFIFFFHIYRNLYFFSFIFFSIWITGFLIFLIYIIISFFGYSLTWTQISYWGIIVITNFISIIPFFGQKIIFWIWGNFFININLINRFFSLHFIFPLIIFFFIFFHINIIHNFKSNNPLGINNLIDQINLFPLSIFKDLNIFFYIFLFIINIIFFPINFLWFW
jgi:ubiquinol-cytochrome c reductase cytochrome b subunit